MTAIYSIGWRRGSPNPRLDSSRLWGNIGGTNIGCAPPPSSSGSHAYEIVNRALHTFSYLGSHKGGRPGEGQA